MDLATLIGIVGAFAIICAAILVGGDFGVFVNVPSLLVVVGGMGSLPGAVLAGFMLGILESFASTTWATTTLPGINQIIIYVVAIIVLLTRPRGLMGRKGVMEE